MKYTLQSCKLGAGGLGVVDVEARGGSCEGGWASVDPHYEGLLDG